jgi:hypothetical protein
MATLKMKIGGLAALQPKVTPPVENEEQHLFIYMEDIDTEYEKKA